MDTRESSTILGTSIASFAAGALIMHWFASRRRRCGLLLAKAATNFLAFPIFHVLLLMYSASIRRKLSHKSSATRARTRRHQSHSPQSYTFCLDHSVTCRMRGVHVFELLQIVERSVRLPNLHRPACRSVYVIRAKSTGGAAVASDCYS